MHWQWEPLDSLPEISCCSRCAQSLYFCPPLCAGKYALLPHCISMTTPPPVWDAILRIALWNLWRQQLCDRYCFPLLEFSSWGSWGSWSLLIFISSSCFPLGWSSPGAMRVPGAENSLGCTHWTAETWSLREAPDPFWGPPATATIWHGLLANGHQHQTSTQTGDDV